MARFDGDYENEYNAWALWEQATTIALGSVKGQQILRDLRDALLALPSKRLISGQLACKGEVCTMGALAAYRRRDEDRAEVLAELERKIDYDEDGPYGGWEADEATILVGQEVGVGVALSSHMAWLNDSYGSVTPEQRYERVLAWTETAIQDLASA